MNNYDAIVVGASNSGLVAALMLLEKGKNVLLLEESNDIGGFNRPIVRGRFSFEPSFHTLFLDNPIDTFNINGLLDELDIKDKIKFSSLPDFYRVITLDVGKSGGTVDYKMPFGIENFVNQIDRYVPGSKSEVEEFFNIAKESKEAINYIRRKNSNVDFNYMKDNYPNFVKVATLSVSKVMDILDIPLEAQEILNCYWLFFGSSETELSFVTYAIFIYDAVNSGLCIPTNKSYYISNVLLNKYLELGGTIKYNSKVIKLMVDDATVSGVRLYDGTLYYSDNIIVNSNILNVYNNLINPDDLPKKAIKYMNQAKIGGRLFTVYLGLNVSAKELGLDSYNYFIYHSLDSDMEYNRMKELNNGNLIATVINNANSDASSDGTTILELSTLYFDNVFSNINNSNYEMIKTNIVNKLIDSFEVGTHIKIRPYIEEIETISPVEVAALNGSIEGSIFGYQLSGEDNVINRMMNDKNDQFIKGLYLCSGFEGDIYRELSSYMQGVDAALKVINGGDK